MAVAAVAARLRAILVDAAACQRQGNELEVLDQLSRVVGILDKFPLPPKSPQADMIATAVQQRATLPERQVCRLMLIPNFVLHVQGPVHHVVLGTQLLEGTILLVSLRALD